MHESLNNQGEPLPKAVALSHIGGRSTQQDYVWPLPGQSAQLDQDGDLLLIVADGAGGHTGGEVASQIAVETIVQEYAKLRQQDHSVKKALVDAIREAHENIQDRQVVELDKQDMASTVVALTMTHDYKIRIANVGDSRAYLYRRGSGLKQLSEDHTLVQEEVRQKNITPEQAKIHPLRHRLSQALGGNEELKILSKRTVVKPNDRYLLCSDGLTDALTNKQIQAVLSLSAPLEQVAQQLMRHALPHAKDNVSFILMDVAPSPIPNEIPPPATEHASELSWPRIMFVVILLLLFVTLSVMLVLNFVFNGISGQDEVEGGISIEATASIIINNYYTTSETESNAETSAQRTITQSPPTGTIFVSPTKIKRKSHLAACPQPIA